MARSFQMIKLHDFFNDGFGWQCRTCTRELGGTIQEANGLSRIMSEGEAESKTPNLSVLAMAKWADPARRSLICPKCGISEVFDKS